MEGLLLVGREQLKMKRGSIESIRLRSKRERAQESGASRGLITGGAGGGGRMKRGKSSRSALEEPLRRSETQKMASQV